MHTIQSLIIKITFYGRIFLVFLVFMSYYKENEMITFSPYEYFLFLHKYKKRKTKENEARDVSELDVHDPIAKYFIGRYECQGDGNITNSF